MQKIFMVLLLSIVLTSTAFAQVPGRVMNEIKSIAKLDWPNDYEMQKYNIDKQMRSYEQVRSLYKIGFRGVPHQTIRSILDQAKQYWPGDYEMQLYNAKRQIRYYLAIN
jgi:hypothetical protein